MFRRIFFGVGIIALAAGSASAQQDCPRRDAIALFMDQARHGILATATDRRDGLERGRATALRAAVALGALGQFASACGCTPLAREFYLASAQMFGAVGTMEQEPALMQHGEEALAAFNRGMQKLRDNECPAIVSNQ